MVQKSSLLYFLAEENFGAVCVAQHSVETFELKEQHNLGHALRLSLNLFVKHK